MEELEKPITNPQLHKKLSVQLLERTTVTEKLDCIKVFHAENLGKEGYYDTVHTLAEAMSDKFFPNKENDSEFNYWFLKYNAHYVFESFKSSKDYVKLTEGNLAENYLRTELSAIEKREEVAKGIIENGESHFDIYNLKGYLDFFIAPNSDYSKAELIETLRVLSGTYYSKNTTPHSHNTLFSPEVKAYYLHILLKEHLLELLGGTTKPGKEGSDNPFPKIFRDGQSYKIFENLHEAYKSETVTTTANYSFVFYSMNKDGFIICRGAEFVRFLSKNYKIDIDRIDSRQSGKNQRAPFYEALKNGTKAH